MKSRVVATVLLVAAVPALLSSGPSGPPALNGEPYIHDPSTIMMCNGKFYTFGTGGGGLISAYSGLSCRPGDPIIFVIPAKASRASCGEGIFAGASQTCRLTTPFSITGVHGSGRN